MKYLSIWESTAEYNEENANRHDLRALMHEADGNPEYAIGSRRKAAKWRAKTAQLEKFMRLPEPLDRLVTIYADKIAAAIINGN